MIEIDVGENQTVRKGQVLFRLDPSDFQVAVAQAEAALAAARFETQGSRAVYDQRNADLAAAQETVAYTQREAARQQALAAAGVATKAQADEGRPRRRAGAPPDRRRSPADRLGPGRHRRRRRRGDRPAAQGDAGQGRRSTAPGWT